MATLSGLLKNALSSSAGVTAIVGTRIYPLELPQTPTYEAITYQRVSNTAQQGSTALRQSRYQINCWAAKYSEAQELAVAVKTALEEYTDTDQIPGIKMSQVANEFDDYDIEATVYRTVIDVILTTTGD